MFVYVGGKYSCVSNTPYPQDICIAIDTTRLLTNASKHQILTKNGWRCLLTQSRNQHPRCETMTARLCNVLSEWNPSLTWYCSIICPGCLHINIICYNTAGCVDRMGLVSTANLRGAYAASLCKCHPVDFLAGIVPPDWILLFGVQSPRCWFCIFQHLFHKLGIHRSGDAQVFGSELDYISSS